MTGKQQDRHLTGKKRPGNFMNNYKADVYLRRLLAKEFEDATNSVSLADYGLCAPNDVLQ